MPKKKAQEEDIETQASMEEMPDIHPPMEETPDGYTEEPLFGGKEEAWPGLDPNAFASDSADFDAAGTDEQAILLDVHQHDEDIQQFEDPEVNSVISSEYSDVEDGPDAVPPPQDSAPNPTAQRQPVRRRRTAERPTQAVSIDEDLKVQSEDERQAYVWMELRNSLRANRVLTGTLGGIERTPTGLPIAVVYYKEQRVVIPASEMYLLIVPQENEGERQLYDRFAQILSRMLGAEIDFIVSGLDRRSESVVASRKSAMLRKQRQFYRAPSRGGGPLITKGKLTEARVIAVGDKNLRVEVFGAETTIVARDVAWEWVDDCSEYYQVGDRVLVKVLSVNSDNPDGIRITASIRDAAANPARENLKKCAVQGKYVGKVTGVDASAIYVRLDVGVNAIAVASRDRRTPCRKDDVSFIITRIDEQRGIVIGIIARILKQYI